MLCCSAALSSPQLASKTVVTTPCQLKHPGLQPAVRDFIASCAKALKACPKGQSAIYAGGQALLEDDGCIACLGAIAAATGATLICENAFPRIDRGAGLPHFQVQHPVVLFSGPTLHGKLMVCLGAMHHLYASLTACTVLAAFHCKLAKEHISIRSHVLT